MTMVDMAVAAAGVRLAVVVGHEPLVVELGDGSECQPESLVPIASLAVGARVALTTTEEGIDLIMGVLGGVSTMSAALPGGYRVFVGTQGPDVGLRVEDEQGAAILAFDPASGSISLAARGELRLAAGVGVRVVAPTVELSSVTSASSPASNLLLDPDGLVLRAPSLRVGVAAVSLDADSAEVRADSVRVRAEDADVGVVRVRLAAERVRATLSSWFAQIKELAQTRTGRLRLIVDGRADVRAGEIRARADREVDIDGSRINLG